MAYSLPRGSRVASLLLFSSSKYNLKNNKKDTTILQGGFETHAFICLLSLLVYTMSTSITILTIFPFLFLSIFPSVSILQRHILCFGRSLVFTDHLIFKSSVNTSIQRACVNVQVKYCPCYSKSNFFLLCWASSSKNNCKKLQSSLHCSFALHYYLLQ